MVEEWRGDSSCPSTTFTGSELWSTKPPRIRHGIPRRSGRNRNDTNSGNAPANDERTTTRPPWRSASQPPTNAPTAPRPRNAVRIAPPAASEKPWRCRCSGRKVMKP